MQYTGGLEEGEQAYRRAGERPWTVGQPALEQCAGRKESNPTGGLESDLGLIGLPAESSMNVTVGEQTYRWAGE